MFIDCSNYDFNGSVKEVKTITISLFEQNGKIEEHLESTEFYRYDKSKNLIEFAHSIPETLSSKTINVYDSENRIIENSHFNNDSLINKTEFSYNSDGLLSEQRFYDKESVLTSTYCPTYTKEGLHIEKRNCEPVFIDGKEGVDGQISFRILPEFRTGFPRNNVHSYKTISDLNGNLLEAAFYNKKNSLLGKIFVVYENKDKPIEINIYGGNRAFMPSDLKNWQKFLFPLALKLGKFQITFYSTYKLFVCRNYRKAFRCFTYGGSFDETRFRYNEKGTLKEINYFSTLTSSSGKMIFEYDEKGNKTQEKSYSENLDRITNQQNYEYEYDSQDNWIKKKTIYRLPVSGRRIMERTIIFSRTIKYY